jgi:hypothetical protein
MVVIVPVPCRCVACGGLIEKGAQAKYEHGKGCTHEKCPEPPKAS